MKKLKITKRVSDKETKEVFNSGEVIERSEARSKDFIKAGVAEYFEPKKETEAEEVKAKPRKKRKSKKTE